jgi:UDP-N-acetyl-D-mannosaminuronate dehydrogenase
MSTTTVVVGLGEVGGPLLEVISAAGGPTDGIDIDTVTYPPRGSVGVLHICIPFEIDDFVGEAARYVALLEPELTVINSTVAVGTTRAVQRRTGAAVAYSPVRGKHARMREELTQYVKYVGADDAGTAQRAAAHFESVGMRTKIVASSETAELTKLSETTYFALLIAWAQTVDRWSEEVGADYDEVVSFYEEVGFFPPVKYFPGVIGGHCAMPNIELLDRTCESPLLDAIRDSNARRIAGDRAPATATASASA